MNKMLSAVVLLAAITANTSWSAVVGHTGKYWTVTDKNTSYKIGNESIDSTLKGINKANLAMFMKRGRVSAHKTSDGSYYLRGHVNGLGGGPMLAGFAYWCTKTLCWGGVAAAGTAAITTGVAAGVALAGGSVAAGTAGGAILTGANLAADAAIAAAGGASTTGVTMVAGSLGYTAAGTALATEGTAALVTASGSMGLIGGIEALALAAYAGALALPTP